MKRIVAVLLAALLTAACLPLGATAADSGVEVVVTADKSFAKPGETVSFTVTLKPTGSYTVGGMAFSLEIPDGLTYVKGSGKVPQGLNDKLGQYKTAFEDSTLVFVSGGAGRYQGKDDLVLLTFSCTANENADGDFSVTLYNSYSERSGSVDMVAPVDSQGNIATIPTTVTAASVRVGTYVYGDVNGDGKINTIDLALLRRYILKWNLSDFVFIEEAADVKGDKKIDIKDLAVLRRYLLKWSGYESLPYTAS